jgi:hypothetical protein
MPYKVNQERRHRFPKTPYRVKNWPDYDAALRRRGDLTIWVTAEAIIIRRGRRLIQASVGDQSNTPQSPSRPA